MPDTPKPEEGIDLDSLSDEEVMNLTPEQIETISEPEEVQETPVVEETPEEPSADPVQEQPEGETPSEDTPAPVEEPKKEEKPAEEPPKEEEKPKTPEAEKPKEEPKPEAKKEETPAEPAPEPKDPSGFKATETTPEDAQAFYKKLMTPFKADGKDFQIRSPEDAIRLIQQGVNYSRRMREMKPIKELNHMLAQHGLNDADKLNFLIDLNKGSPEAIKKLMLDHKIDPLNIDITVPSEYKSGDYRADPVDVNFREALENTVEMPGGRELLADVNKSWDGQSKEFLRENPSILKDILDQKDSGIYDKIITELEYQKSIGYLTDIPFIQGYHQVGTALDKAGAFKTENVAPTPEAGLVLKEPLDTGTRKAATKPKTEQPNQTSSVSQPSSAPSIEDSDNETDYSTMSDEDFLKLQAPAT